MKKVWLIALLTAACAEEVPGFAPPPGQLYFPIGMSIATTSRGPVLLVGNSNFDQRYNAGYVSALDVVKLQSLATAPITGLSATAPAGDQLHVIESFPDAYLSQTKVLQLGGPILHVPSASTGLNGDRVFVASRGLNKVTMLALDIDASTTNAQWATLRCRSNNGAEIEATDCTDGWVVSTDFEDPFALAYLPVAGGAGVVAVSYLTGAVDQNQTIVSAISALDIAQFEKRTSEDGDANPGALTEPLRTASFTQFGGTGALTTVPAAVSTDPTRLFGAASIAGNAGMALSTFGVAGAPAAPVIERLAGLDLGGAASVSEIRGVAATPTRAYASVRFLESSSAHNAGVAVLDISGTTPVLLTIFEVGDELGQPVLDPTGRFLYLPDIRDDSIYVLDVGADQPLFVAAIRGRMQRTQDGTVIEARILASPNDLVFDTRDGKTLLYVTNFANSTLAVIDASDPDPRRHRLIARFGRDLDADGKSEGEE